ncbi:hypothetical protein M8J76_009416 [Diaphorina citri]|nr:hypothetical protein M8J76_009416 [Diaphorina citri]
MGPKKRKSKDLEDQTPTESPPKPDKKSRNTKVEKKANDKSQNKKPTKPETSKYFGKKKSTEDTSSKPSTSGLNVREVTINQALDVDTVKKMIKDKENKISRAAKRLADLPPIDGSNESSNENSKNILNQTSEKSETLKSLGNFMDFSTFPNVTKFVLGRQVHGDECKSMREVQNWCLSKNLLDFKLLDRNSFVQARITCLVWNKYRPQQVAFSDKHGHIVVGDLKQTDYSVNWKLLLQKNGIGPGGNVLAMKFAKSQRPDHYTLWNVGLEGMVVRIDCALNEEILAIIPEDTTGGSIHFSEYLHTNNYDHWYTGMDLTPDEKIVAAGCSKGFVTFMDMDGTTVEKFQAAKTKITHLEFCPRNPTLFVTASLDKTVKIWDRRYVKSKKDFIAELSHLKAVNSAYFK